MPPRPRRPLASLALALALTHASCTRDAHPAAPAVAAPAAAAPAAAVRDATAPALAVRDATAPALAVRDATARDAAAPAPAPAPAPAALAAPVTLRLRLASAPFPDHPEVAVYAPTGLRTDVPPAAVVYLHGWNDCLDVVLAAQNAPCTPGGRPRYAFDLVARFEQSGVNALLVAPQLAFEQATTNPGRLGARDGFRAMLAETLAHPSVAALFAGRTHAPAQLRRVVLVAHSAGWHPAATILQHGGVDVHEVLLLDALYRDMPSLESWVTSHARDFARDAARPRRLALVWTDRERTGPRTRSLVARLAPLLPPGARAVDHAELTQPDPAAYAAPLLALRTAVTHEALPQVYLPALLDGARLGRASR